MNESNKKTVLIIGGTSGIGLETAHIFSNDHQVVIVSRNPDKISDDNILDESIKLSFDITCQREGLMNAVEDLGISKIVHCAGVFRQEEQDEQEYKDKYEQTKLGGFWFIKDFMDQHPNQLTHVCATSSLFTFLPSSSPLVPVYEKKVSKELEEEVCSLKGVVANCVAPGLTRTPLTEKAYGEDGMKTILEYAPGSRILQPSEVAEKIYELSNQEEIAGEVVPVDGEYLKFFNEK